VLDRGAGRFRGQKQRIALARAFLGDPCLVRPRRAQLESRRGGSGSDRDPAARKKRGVTAVVVTCARRC